MMATPRETLIDSLRIERPAATARAHPIAWALLVAGCIGVITLFLVARRAVPVTAGAAAVTSPASPAETPGALDASGYVVARRQATVSAKVTGRLVAVFVEEGRRVEAGQVIARLDDTTARAELQLANARHESAAAALRGAELAVANAAPIFERTREQYARALISAQEHDAARARYDELRSAAQIAARDVAVAVAAVNVARQTLDDTVVRAPFAGVITVKAAQEGEIVSPASSAGGFTRTGIGTIVDMESLEVEVDVSESYIQRVRADQRAIVRLGAYPRWEIPAHVIAVVPNADRAKATVRVRVALEERDARVLPNMGARVSFREPS